MSNVTVLGVGDLILQVPDIGKYFDPARDILRSGDITIGQIETPHTNRGHVCNPEPRMVPPAPPENLDCLPDAGFDVCGFGGNHTFDQGYYGVMDTLDRLKQNGILTCGAGENIEEACKPALLERKGQKFAVFQYDCIGPVLSWASPMKAGAAFVRALTIYESEFCEPAAMPDYAWTVVDPWSLQNMVKNIEAHKAQGYTCIVSLHIGRMYDKHVLPYEMVITHAAVDAGAGMVICQHTHECRGISVYKGVPIYHNLGNFLTLTSMMNFDSDSPVKAQSLYKPFEYPGVNPVMWSRNTTEKNHETGIPNYVFSNCSRNTLIAKAVFSENGLVEAGFYPCYMSDKGEPTPVNRDGKGADVLECFRELNRIAELPDDIFSWSGNGEEVMIRLN